jgi:DNA polymerase III delta prime subunit
LLIFSIKNAEIQIVNIVEKKKINKNLYKLIILDEADSITNKAQNLLSNIIYKLCNILASYTAAK